MSIDWTDPQANVTPHFLVKDAITLHAWNRLATDKDGLDDNGKAQLILTFQMMEMIRDFLGVPINVHCGYRSPKYNISQGILLPTGKDVHALFEAVDWDAAPHLTIQQVKDKLVPMLDKFQIRLEKGTTTWIHTDRRAPGPSGRYFTP